MRKTTSPTRTRPSARCASCIAFCARLKRLLPVPRRSTIGAMITNASRIAGATAAITSAFWCPLKKSTDENMITPRMISATMFSSVCETTVPSTTGNVSRGRPVRRATISARDGSPRRAGSVEDISTPIIVPRIASPELDPRLGQRRLQDRVPREAAHHHRQAHRAQAEQHVGRLRVDQRLADVGDPDLLQRQVGERDHAEREGEHRRRGGRARSARRRGLLAVERAARDSRAAAPARAAAGRQGRSRCAHRASASCPPARASRSRPCRTPSPRARRAPRRSAQRSSRRPGPARAGARARSTGRAAPRPAPAGRPAAPARRRRPSVTTSR